MESRNKHAVAPHGHGWGRAARAGAAVGAMAVAAGLALAASVGTASATPGDPHKVWICHATSSDTNPYVAINVDVASKQYEAHMAHKTEPNKFWKSDGTFQGVDHSDGDPKPDIIGDDENVLTPESCADFETPPDVQPDPVVETVPEEEMSCELGYRSRENTVTKEYVWDDESDSWVLEPEADWTTTEGAWSDYRELTSEEITELGCVLGTETVVPKPDESKTPEAEPTVLGTEAVVPSAVDAGLSGDSGDSGGGGPTALLAGAALALLTAGAAAAARMRRGGEHEA